MPVIDHATHERTVLVEGTPYGCHNKSFRDAFEHVNAHAQVSLVPHRMSKTCRYDKSLGDARCAGCKHIGSGEQYAAEVLKCSTT